MRPTYEPMYGDAVVSLLGETKGGGPSKGPISEWQIFGDITPPTESEIQVELTRLKAEYDALAWSRNRTSEYPTIDELTIALYDTDDKAALETKRAAVKTKWPKDNSGPVE